MAATLHSARIALLAADGVEQVELLDPWRELEHAGATVDLLSTGTGQIQATNQDIYPAERFDVDRAVGEAAVDDNLITSRGPNDLPAFCASIVHAFARASASA